MHPNFRGKLDVDIPLCPNNYIKNKPWQIFSFILALEILAGILLWYPLKVFNAEAEINATPSISEDMLLVMQGNSLLSNRNTPPLAPGVKKTYLMIVTAYSSTPWETDNTPHLTSAGTYVRPGVVANNMLPLGTKIRIPELYGDRIFVVEDRMNPKKGFYQLDIWLPSYWEAKQFGAKKAYVEILE